MDNTTATANNHIEAARCLRCKNAIFARCPELSEDEVFSMKLNSITAIEKLIGKKRFNEILSDVVIKPQGKPTLVPLEDKRPAMGYNQAQLDFAEEA